MSQPDSKPQPATNVSAGKPSDPKSSPKAGAHNGPPPGGLRGFWYLILLVLVVAVFAGYWVENNTQEQRPVVSAAEDAAVVVDPEAGGESASSAPALVISSDVRGADVYLNGTRVGKTPHKATPLSPGDYDVRVVHEGYETFEEQVHVATPDDSIHAALRPVSNESVAGEEMPAPEDIRGLANSVAVKHKHRIGSCEGVLRADDDGLRYDSEHKDAFLASYADIEELKLDGNDLTVEIRDVRKYDFTEPNDDEEALAVFHQRVDAAIPKAESADN